MSLLLMQPLIIRSQIPTQILTTTASVSHASTLYRNIEYTFNTSDSLTDNFGTLTAYCPPPSLCINPGPIEIVNPVLPKLPLAGNTIAYNMSIAPVSLVANNTSNNQYDAGLYAFYIKNNSVWCKFKTNASTWSTEEYLITCGNEVGVVEARVIFDCDGYPITAYRDLNGYIGVNYYLDGINMDNTTTFNGTSPNLIIYNNQILVMFIPSGYNGDLIYLSSKDCYVKECYYPVNIPNNVVSFTLRQTTNSNWVFTFVSQNNNINSIYYAEVA